MRSNFRPTTSKIVGGQNPEAKASGDRALVPTTKVSRRRMLIGSGTFVASVMGLMAFGKDLVPSIELAALIDPTTGCPTKIPATTAIVLDVSDEFLPIHVQRTLKTIEEEAAALPSGGRLVLFTMNANMPDDLTQRLLRCSPGRPIASDWTQGSAYAARKFENDFVGEFRSFAEKAIAGARSTVSPIIETTAAITRDPVFDATVGNRRLVWVTDGLQNDRLPINPPLQRKRDRSGRFTLYAVEDAEALYRRSRLAQQIPADLTGATVSIAYLVRPEAQRFQTPAQRVWLNRRFREAGAKEVSFRGIPADQIASR